MTATPETPSTDRAGVLPGVVHLALDAVDRGQATAIGVLQDARTELRASLDGGLDLAEKLTASALRFARNVVHKLDDAGSQALASTQRALGDAIHSARATTHAATELATTAASSVAGRVHRAA